MKGGTYQLNRKARMQGEHGLPKKAVEMVYVSRTGMDGDFNVYRHEKKKDALDRALLLLPIETIRDLNREEWPVKPGDLGENVTTEGIPYSAFVIGKAYQAGGAIVEVTAPCNPCVNVTLLPYVGERGAEFLRTLVGRRGWYARVLVDGTCAKGDSIEEIAKA